MPGILYKKGKVFVVSTTIADTLIKLKTVCETVYAQANKGKMTICTGKQVTSQKKYDKAYRAGIHVFVKRILRLMTCLPMGLYKFTA